LGISPQGQKVSQTFCEERNYSRDKVSLDTVCRDHWRREEIRGIRDLRKKGKMSSSFFRMSPETGSGKSMTNGEKEAGDPCRPDELLFYAFGDFL
jgi:hypothetical protein